MKTTLLRGCPNGKTCPELRVSDRGTLIVRGYVTDQEALEAMDLAAGMNAVEIPPSLLPELGVDTGPGDTLLVPGLAVTDPQALADIDLPANEAAVEISMLPELTPEVARAQ